MLSYAAQATAAYIDCMPKAQRKKYGQFFTSAETARFMASLFDIPEQEAVSILDPGAGSGMLSAALIERLQTVDAVKEIHLTCYENDPNVLPLLRENLVWVAENSRVKVTYNIKADNYILSQADAYKSDLSGQQYDLVIGNPPYKRVSKAAPEVAAMPDVCYGAPNLYFLFAAMSLSNLRDRGELVYIIPRSWAAGAYFKRFREKFLRDGALEHIHLFTDRSKVFDRESVLQETMIIKVRKSPVKPRTITVTTTQGNADFVSRTVYEAPYDTVVDRNTGYVFLVTSREEAEVLNQVNIWPDTLLSLGLRVKTGLVVEFRNREALRDEAEEGAIPMFLPGNIQEGGVSFPASDAHRYIVSDQGSLRQKNTNYLFLKRFTTNEEHRRLQCCIYLADKFPEYEEISTQNMVNFICGAGELPVHVVYGLYVLFNSTLYDQYYRILGGSTQVNASEISSIPVPPMLVIEEMGRELMRFGDLSEESCDRILEGAIREREYKKIA